MYDTSCGVGSQQLSSNKDSNCPSGFTDAEVLLNSATASDPNPQPRKSTGPKKIASKVSKGLVKIARIRSMFQQQRRQDISMDNLVFSLPSLDTSHAGSDRAADDIGSNSVAPALRYGVPENVPVLEYERWLLGVLSQVETFNERDVDVLRIARTSLHEEVTVEWARIQGLKRSAWEMQHAFVSPNDSNIAPQSETANKQNWIYTGASSSRLVVLI
ncbi:hypothetical protein WOLCODRAFT_159449 [Wolfiporia cocos MD-104 SS10]|uniref:Uncharacterized protein n=1 Tax=Wolfiporia cocos (strain MD-104) TaxID=742152 RepID=A0A2H3J163_WOLCO|nr:hypothetical protein WOLCODRAFT_159449 [Wolfiporia cocos MD-104 SS10]